MQLSELNIGDTFSVNIGNYLVINPNTDNFKITHYDEYHDMDNYQFVLNLDTSTLGILLKTKEVELDD